MVETISVEVMKRKRKIWEDLFKFLEGRTLSLESLGSFLSKCFYEKEWTGGVFNTAKSDLVTTIKVMYQVDWSENPTLKAILRSVKKLSCPKVKYLLMWDIAKLYN